MIYNKIKEKYIHIYVLSIGIIGLMSIDPSHYLNNFIQNSTYPIMDIMYVIFHLSFFICGLYTLIKKRNIASRICLYLTTITFSFLGFNYLISGPLQFIVGIYFENQIIYVANYRAYGGFSFYYDSHETIVFGIGLNITSILMIVVDKLINGKE